MLRSVGVRESQSPSSDFSFRFLAFNKHTFKEESKWTCPICQLPAYSAVLYVDCYIQAILNALPSHLERVEIGEEGWIPITGNTRTTTSQKPVTASTTIDLTDDVSDEESVEVLSIKVRFTKSDESDVFEGSAAAGFDGSDEVATRSNCEGEGEDGDGEAAHSADYAVFHP